MDRIKSMLNTGLDPLRCGRSLVIVSLGDSYSSGEGIEPYYNQSSAEKFTDADFLAHRSEMSWPGRLTLAGVRGKMAEHRNENWFFAAASGARIAHIWEKQPKTCRARASLAGESAPIYRTYPTRHLDPQIDIFKSLGDKKADYVTLTLGGNDAGFGEIITHAIAGHTYVGLSFLKLKLASLWRRFYEPGGIRDGLLKAYCLISETAGPQAQIIVAGYPMLFSQHGSRTLFSKQAASLMNGAVSDLNKHIEYLVNSLQARGVAIHFVSVEKEFASHGAYAAFSDDPDARDSTEFIHRIVFGAGENDIDASKPAYAGSLHPNLTGSEIYRALVQRKIDSLEALRLRTILKTGEAPIYSAPDFSSAPFSRSPDIAKDDEFWAVAPETAEKALVKASEKASPLPYIVGGAAAMISVGALVGAAAVKRARALRSNLKYERCYRCGMPVAQSAKRCPICGADRQIEGDQGDDGEPNGE